MGNAASKASRKLPKTGNVISAVKLNPNPNQAPSASGSENRLNYYQPNDGFDPDFDSKLKKIGAVQFKEVPLKYAKDSQMLQAVEARNQLDERMERELKDYKIPRTQLHPSTIFSLLQSRKEGDSDENIKLHFNLDPQFLARLGTRVSIPDPPKAARLRQKQREREAEELKRLSRSNRT